VDSGFVTELGDIFLLKLIVLSSELLFRRLLCLSCRR